MAWRWQPGAPRLLSLWANRDEWYARPTQPLAVWPENPAWVGGRDLLAGGSWLLVDTAAGRLAAITNVREAQGASPGTPGARQSADQHAPPALLSRGALVAQVLAAGRLDTSAIDPTRYAGFNLLFLDWRAGKAAVCTNRSAHRMPGQALLKPVGFGSGSLSNGPPDAPLPKQQRLAAALDAACHAVDTHTWAQAGWQALRDRWIDPALASSRYATDRFEERALAPVFVDTPLYGTRQSTLLQVDADGKLCMWERSWIRARSAQSGADLERDFSEAVWPTACLR